MSEPPVCARCGAPAVVQWARRPTPAELDQINTVAAERRRELLLLADPEGPPPVIGPGYTEHTDHTAAVYGCAAHTITMDLATRIHTAGCTAPNDKHLPGCDCQPEPAPGPHPPAGDPGEMVTLPTGWVVPAAAVKKAP